MTIIFEEPWEMTHLESVDNLIHMVESTLKPADPLYGKEIYISGKHDTKPLLLVDNDTDGTYAVVEIIKDLSLAGYYSQTINYILVEGDVSKMIRHDHQELIKNYQNDN